MLPTRWGSALLALAVIFLLGCTEKRTRSILLVSTVEKGFSELTELSNQALQDGYVVDSISSNDRLGDAILPYEAVILLEDPAVLNVLWQIDIQRYVESGGGLILPDQPINQYQWNWLWNAQNVGQSNDDGRKVTFISGSNLSWDQVKSGLGSGQIRRDQIRTDPIPDWNRFTVKVLDADINEPMEMAILPKGRVLFSEREGNLKLYDPIQGRSKVIHTFKVSTEGNYEDGMLGLAADPDFENNNWIYIYYSPYGGEGRQNLSRFMLLDDSLIVSSEKIVLEVPVQRETCCHSGGSIAFGPNGNLFLSTGDNTSSKESDGYSPLDERPGRGPFDAQKGSSNTHDLRGKILRISPLADGTYEIPEGNLFPVDGSAGRPEIYTMGCRNPFRFSVDQKTGFVYWGDVGPDSGKDSDLGPQSYDEWNQAKTPGNYGWPYFVADNKAYPMYDFETEEIGKKQDPAKPVNNSPNNYGAKELPPARTAMIWYPYGASEIWPMLGRGSRSAMAGPVYYPPSEKSEVSFPDYYEGKLFIYEWARSWIKVVSFDEDWNVKGIESFMPDLEISKPIDMEFDAFGSMYLLEYGENYFSNNNDARLIKIEYASGNRAPVAVLNIDRVKGAAPLSTGLSAEGSFDYDKEDSLSFSWDIAGEKVEGKSIDYTFNDPGEFNVELMVTDNSGESTVLSKIVTVGNDIPEISLVFEANRSFYFDRNSYRYTIQVIDKEDGSTAQGTIPAENVSVDFMYLESGYDMALLGETFFSGQAESIDGKLLIDGSDCASCHSIDQKSIGPSYTQIADRYSDDYDAPNYLAEKILNGGNGNWGESLMAAHPQHSREEALKMVDYILSFGQDKTEEKGLVGQIAFNAHGEEQGIYVLGVQYSDNAVNGVSKNESNELFVFKSPVIEAENYDRYHQVSRIRPQGGSFEFLAGIRNGSYVGYDNVDLSNLTAINLRIRKIRGGIVNVRLDQPQGPVIGSTEVKASTADNWWEEDWSDVEIKLNDPQDFHTIFLEFQNNNDEGILALDYLEFRN
jgi:cytochrome c